MLSLLGSLLGFGTSFLPKILGFFEAKRDQAHELAIMKQQQEMQQLAHTNRLEAVGLDGDIRAFEAAHRSMDKPSGIKWIDGLRASVRPMVTYIFVIEFVIMQFVVFYALQDAGDSAVVAVRTVLDDKFVAGFWGIIGFWFGDRAFNK